jgi:ribosomal protein S18 acetylase RimI-like enzyme
LIDNLYVQPELRGSGLANRLFESACDWSRNRGLRQVRLKVYEANRGAVRFYEQKLGMRRIDTTFQLDL